MKINDVAIMIIMVQQVFKNQILELTRPADEILEDLKMSTDVVISSAACSLKLLSIIESTRSEVFYVLMGDCYTVNF